MPTSSGYWTRCAVEDRWGKRSTASSEKAISRWRNCARRSKNGSGHGRKAGGFAIPEAKHEVTGTALSSADSRGRQLAIGLLVGRAALLGMAIHRRRLGETAQSRKGDGIFHVARAPCPDRKSTRLNSS